MLSWETTMAQAASTPDPSTPPRLDTARISFMQCLTSASGFLCTVTWETSGD